MNDKILALKDTIFIEQSNYHNVHYLIYDKKRIFYDLNYRELVLVKMKHIIEKINE